MKTIYEAKVIDAEYHRIKVEVKRINVNDDYNIYQDIRTYYTSWHDSNCLAAICFVTRINEEAAVKRLKTELERLNAKYGNSVRWSDKMINAVDKYIEKHFN